MEKVVTARELEKLKSENFDTPVMPDTHIEKPLHPALASLIGGLADTASTYTFLKRGTAREDNKLVAGLSKHPAGMALAGIGATLALQPARKLIGKASPQLANALAANQGALQLGYSAGNLDDEPGKSSDTYRFALKSAMENNIRRQQGLK